MYTWIISGALHAEVQPQGFSPQIYYLVLDPSYSLPSYCCYSLATATADDIYMEKTIPTFSPSNSR